MVDVRSIRGFGRSPWTQRVAGCWLLSCLLGKNEQRATKLSSAFFMLVALSVGVFLFARTDGTKTQAQLSPAGPQRNNTPILSACSGSTVLFPRLRLSSIETWSNQYHYEVSKVVNAVAAEQPVLACLKPRSEDVPAELRSLAQYLPPWSTPERLQSLRTEDVGSVLLEYLRLYECALQERSWEIPERAALEERAKAEDEKRAFIGFPIFDLTVESTRQMQFIEREMAIARPAMTRTLLFLAGTQRLRPLSQNMECLSRASADLRNALGLAAETSACIPKIWDARGTLRNSTFGPKTDE